MYIYQIVLMRNFTSLKGSVSHRQNKPPGSPWLTLFTRLIDHKSVEKLLELFKLAVHKVSFGVEVFDLLHI